MRNKQHRDLALQLIKLICVPNKVVANADGDATTIVIDVFSERLKL